MELSIGDIYKSPIHGRYIQFMGIDQEDPNSYTITIYWVDKDTLEGEPDQIVVQKSDVFNWIKVEL